MATPARTSAVNRATKAKICSRARCKACSFCNVVYHNTPACLGSNVLCEAAIANEDYEWACPKCFKIAVRELIKPKTQAASAEKEEQEVVAGRGAGVYVVARW